jgi:hypothetical protein
MDQASFASLATELFMAIQLISGYPAPAEPPRIHVVPQPQLAQMFCGKPCKVRAIYLRDDGVYLDDSLDVVNSTFDRSILLHELVHHVQAVSGGYGGNAPDCERWNKAEIEAYSLQNKYLTLMNTGTRVSMMGAIGRCF